jgi:hypothetical protein
MARARRRGMGYEASWNQDNIEMNTFEFQQYIKLCEEQGLEPINIIMEVMMSMNVSLEDLQDTFSIILFLSFTD